jgi:hypothetical protein
VMFMQMSADGESILVGETWAGRVTRWACGNGTFLGTVATMSYPLGVINCGVGAGAGIVAVESVASQYST